ncbi:hypothetical protein PF002_g13611 [Phytophthora fragariae]|uniref:Uncharacterized protein n=1 Tax=Phytophthora fragariae TaxID=53985 RepID=A0A6A3Z2M0_9STRA|nr:hypothetical protein PF006_g10814 [Phytophthora fragariae]KAE9228215.1 hypothetical protein PF002_g13611 [Phytophthora fragariae]
MALGAPSRCEHLLVRAFVLIAAAAAVGRRFVGVHTCVGHDLLGEDLPTRCVLYH